MRPKRGRTKMASIQKGIEMDNVAEAHEFVVELKYPKRN